MSSPQFPTLNCRCINDHVWAILVPNYWFSIKDMECPYCGDIANAMKAGDWRTLEQVKEAQEKSQFEFKQK